MRLTIASFVALACVSWSFADEEKIALDKLPKTVVEAVQKRFPKLKMTEASKEKDGDKIVYEVSIDDKGKNIDVTITEAGVITLIETEIEIKDLPKAVAATFNEKYPKAKYEIIETITKVNEGKESLEYYEATLTFNGKKWEVEITPDGKVKSANEVKEKK